MGAQNDPQRHTRTAAYALVRRDGAVLLTRASASADQPGTWWLPGGALRFGEGPEAAAVRATAAETGIEVRLTGDAETSSEVAPARDGTEVHHVRLVYCGEAIGGTLAAEQHGSTDLAAWVPLDRARSLRLAGFVRQVLGHHELTGT